MLVALLLLIRIVFPSFYCCGSASVPGLDALNAVVGAWCSFFLLGNEPVYFFLLGSEPLYFALRQRTFGALLGSEPLRYIGFIPAWDLPGPVLVASIVRLGT